MSYQIHNLHSRIKTGKNLNTGLIQTLTCFCFEQSENLKERKMSRRKKRLYPGLLSISFPLWATGHAGREKGSPWSYWYSLHSAMKGWRELLSSELLPSTQRWRNKGFLLPPYLSSHPGKKNKSKQRGKRPCITHKSISFACSRPFALFYRFQLEKGTSRKRIHWNGCKCTTFEFSKRVGGDRNKEPVISPQKQPKFQLRFIFT